MPDGRETCLPEGRSRPVDRALLATVAEVLLVNGQTTEGTRVALARLGRAFGCDVRLFEAWGLATIEIDDGGPTQLVLAEPSGVDIGRVIATERLIDGVCAGDVAPAEALLAMRAIKARPPVPLARFAIMAAAGASALGVIFGAPNLLTLGVIALLAGLGACLRRALSHLSGNPFLQPLMAALLAGAGGGLVSMAGLDLSHRLVVACPCMVLVPGPHFLNGMIDLARGRMPIGLARIAFAGLVVVAICAGLLIGLSLTGGSFPEGGTMPPVPLWRDVGAAGIAVAAYGSFFNMPWRMLPGPIAVGVLAHALRWWVLDSGTSLHLGALSACLLVGTATAPLARSLRMPFGACAFASVASLIPGIFMFEAASGAVSLVALGTKASPGDLLALVESVATASLVLLAMGAGLIVPKMVVDALADRRTSRRRHGP